MRTEDGKIINRCLNGEPEAFGFLVDKYKACIYALAYSKVHNFHDAQDITQEVFLQAYRDLRKLKNGDSFLWWIYSIAYNTCKNWLRAQSTRPDIIFIKDQDELDKILESSSIEAYRDDLEIESLHEVPNSLPKTYREVLTLYYLGGMDSVEIARMLGTTPTAIRHRLSRARTQLRGEVIAMMSDTFQQNRLQASFTFKLVEAVKRIRIHPISTTKGVPWGLSLATGVIVAILSLNPHIPQLDQFGTISGTPLQSESKVLKVGEIPVDILKTSSIAILSSKMGKGSVGEPRQRDIKNAFFMAPQGEGEWTKKADMPTARTLPGIAIVDGKIYAFGGRNWANYLANVEEYDPIKDKWEIKSSMPRAELCPVVCSFNGKIYYFNSIDCRVDEYDPALDKWTAKNDSPEGLYIVSPCVLGSKIYTFGYDIVGNGMGDRRPMYEYDPAKDSWTFKADIQTHTKFSPQAVLNGKIYFIGGFDGQKYFSAVKVYDPVADTWEEKSDKPTTIMGSKCVIGTKIYDIGGTNIPGGIPFFTTVDIYDTLTDTWTKGTDMQTSRTWFAANVVDGRIYLIGGYDGVNILSLVEEFDTGFISVDPGGKLSKTWGTLKAE